MSGQELLARAWAKLDERERRAITLAFEGHESAGPYSSQEEADSADSSSSSASEAKAELDQLVVDEHDKQHKARCRKMGTYFDEQGTLRNPDGTRSIFDDVDQ